MLIRDFEQNHGDDTGERHRFVLGQQKRWTF
jgi:hypothetical protein